ncbi:thiol:disulfide interchange protein TlpA [Pseudochelatococcus contaminans]|uniref:Thiol-disulfide isomerase/thioredoxin n=1 Tax=Pseudochelatococcus contaminans TaxID=1538103 RepID=A0A7W5Z1I7_9HYPH|nr:TlpA disulfide reductase family protein [Pseudochelatococcus contaminans]MBB3808375.1 thiol-disulfide isomerase/thioredoxin [Pseudochelatococcus contaminans]
MSLHPRRLAAISLAALVIVGGGIAYEYGWKRGPEKTAACTASPELLQRLKPLAAGEVAAVQIENRPAALSELAFLSPDGKPLTLADFRGRTVLLNLWATWCVPCRQEMPALDALQDKLGSDDFEVVAVNIDTREPEKATQWLADNNISRLAAYSDPTAKIFQTLRSDGKAFGMPTTLLIGPDGCSLGHLAGAAEWASDDAVNLVRAAIGG